MRAVKPYYVSGYKNRILNRFARIITIFSYKTKGNYKILPFLPVVLFVPYPLFFNVNFTVIINERQALLSCILALLPLDLIVAITIIWWMYCAENFSMKWLLEPFKDYKKYKEEKDLFMSIFVLVMGVILIVGLLLFFFFGVSLVVGISGALTMITKNETITFYIATLPLALALSYLAFRELEKNQRDI